MTSSTRSPASDAHGGLPAGTMRRVREYVDVHLSESINLAMLAAVAGLSMHHFAREFRQSSGVTPHHYLTQKRVERAQEMLTQTDLSLSEIAYTQAFRPKPSSASFVNARYYASRISVVATLANPIDIGSVFRIFRNGMVAFECLAQRVDLLQQPLGLPAVQTARVQNTTRNVHCSLAELSANLSKIDADLPFIGRIAAPFDMA